MRGVCSRAGLARWDVVCRRWRRKRGDDQDSRRGGNKGDRELIKRRTWLTSATAGHGRAKKGSVLARKRFTRCTHTAFQKTTVSLETSCTHCNQSCAAASRRNENGFSPFKSTGKPSNATDLRQIRMSQSGTGENDRVQTVSRQWSRQYHTFREAEEFAGSRAVAARQRRTAVHITARIQALAR